MPHLPDATPAILLRSEYTSIASTMGIGYLGVAFSSMLYAVICCQTFAYYRSPRCKDDNGFLKLFVAIVWMLDTAQQTIVTYAFYHYLILNFGDVRALTIISWGVPTWMVFNVVIGIIEHTFLVYRVFKFSRNIWIAAICAIFGIIAFGLNLAYSAKAFSIAFFDVAEEKLEPIGVYALSIGLLGDTSVAIAMTYYFYKSRTGFGRSDGMISKLIVLTVGTGSLTSFFEFANLVAYLAAPFSFYDLFFNMALSKLYANTVLTVLNSRANILDTMQVFKIDSVVRKGLAERKKRESDWTILSSIHLQLPEEDLSGAV